tara:strand:+ start:254 stop:493 length:240 start_codon:yes stop_codon:yes gene_type:complete
MPKRSSIAMFIAATSALSIAVTEDISTRAGENEMGGLKEWNTDMPVSADFVLDQAAQELADKAAKSSACIPIGEGENCW